MTDSNAESQQLTKRGIEALKQGDKLNAAKLLHQATKVNPNNQSAWLWLSGCVDSNEDKRTCLNKVIAIDANSEAGKRAAKGLEHLRSIELPNADVGMSKQSIPTPIPAKDTQEKPQSQTSPTQPKKNNKQLTCLVIIGAILFSCSILFSFALPDEDTTQVKDTPTQVKDTPTPKPLHDKNSAQIMCRQFVEQTLKAPASAKFAPWSDDEDVEYLGEGKYRVISYVDSQNSFGAMLRMYYICTVQHVEEMSWKLVSLETN